MSKYPKEYRDKIKECVPVPETLLFDDVWASVVLSNLQDSGLLKEPPKARDIWVTKEYLFNHCLDVRLVPPGEEDGPKEDWIHVKEILDEP